MALGIGGCLGARASTVGRCGRVGRLRGVLERRRPGAGGRAWTTRAGPWRGRRGVACGLGAGPRRARGAGSAGARTRPARPLPAAMLAGVWVSNGARRGGGGGSAGSGRSRLPSAAGGRSGAPTPARRSRGEPEPVGLRGQSESPGRGPSPSPGRGRPQSTGSLTSPAPPGHAPLPPRWSLR